MYDTTKPYIAKIKELIAKTWEECNELQVADDTGKYPSFKRTTLPALGEIDHTDGIGTKGMLHWYNRTFRSAVQDAFAMNYNDLMTVGASPYKAQNHLIVPHDDHSAILEIVTALADLCCRHRIALTGGETSVQDNLQGMDLSITMSGIRMRLISGVIRPGDDLVALPSTGLHSNGFTKVRELFSKRDWSSPGKREELTKPTAVYDLGPVWSLINCAVHIAGGGFTRLKPLLEGCVAQIWNCQNTPYIFREICRYGIPAAEMYRTFNCGIGMVLAVPSENTQTVLARLPGSYLAGIALKSAAPGVSISSWLRNEPEIVEF